MDSALVVGSLAFDDLDMPSGNFRNVLGGAATYSSIAASFLSPVQLVGVIGNDFEEKHLEMMRTRGVDTTGVERIASGKTFRWHGRYSEDLASRESLDTQLNVFADFRPKIPDAYKKSSVVLLGNIHPKLQSDVLAQCPPSAFSIADTMNFWISGERSALGDVLSKVDLLVINEEEARQLAGNVTPLIAVARAIRKLGPTRLIIKRGEHGACLFDDEGVFFVPGFPLEEVRDPTGAGDTFAGGLAGYLARARNPSTQSVRRGMFYASALASFCVEGIGPERLMAATKGDLAARIEQFTKMVDYGGTLEVG